MPRTIRDFVYIDTSRLQSLYSQVFEGVAENIVRQTLDQSARQLTTDDKGKSSSLETQVAEALFQTESSILHDHMYNRLELELGDAVSSPTEITRQNFREILNGSFLIKVRGRAEIEDYRRIREFTTDFNSIGESIAYCGLSSTTDFSQMKDAAPEMIRQLEAELRTVGKTNPLRQELTQQVQALKKLEKPEELVKEFAKESNLHLDPFFLQAMDRIFKFFYPEGFEITIVPKDNSEVVFRGILERDLLRLAPEYLRNLYGGYVEAEWVMVGQVTYMPGSQIPPLEIDDSLASSDVNNATEDIGDVLGNMQNAPADASPMRDPFRGLAKHAAGLEKMFFESKLRDEILIRPLAIYQETQL